MSKRIISVSFPFPGGDVEECRFSSDRSLLDADIIIFQPRALYHSREKYRGKPTLDDDDSFQFKENLEHWRTELSIAARAGKTIIIYLSKLQEFYVHTGQKQYSGTGRNRQVTNIVELVNNYGAIPLDLGMIVSKRGDEIRPSSNLGVIANYWREYGIDSPYQVYFADPLPGTILTTKTGQKSVGAIISTEIGKFILLPPLQYLDNELTELYEEEEVIWEDEDKVFGQNLIACLLEIDAALRASSERTPPPEWVQKPEFRLKEEVRLSKELTKVIKKIDGLQTQRQRLETQMQQEGLLRNLLYEQGTVLEAAVLEALKVLGFEAESIEEADSQFDAVFVSPEGRFLGEVEGKTNRPINIDKLSQLERNIQEDFTRDDVSEYANGVLFGNTLRLQPLAERSEYFTDKCLSGAKRSGIALVRTPDLFFVAKYLQENNDPVFAQECREAIAQTKGSVVSFPPIPSRRMK